MDSGSRQPAAAAASCAAFSVTPASTAMVRSTGSTPRTRFMRARLITTWPGRFGTAPPTMLVLPPWGTIASPFAAHSRTAPASSAVLAGRNTAAGGLL